jgi:hypothetical protein
LNIADLMLVGHRQALKAFVGRQLKSTDERCKEAIKPVAAAQVVDELLSNKRSCSIGRGDADKLYRVAKL